MTALSATPARLALMRAGAVLAALLMLAGCSDPPVEGVVEHKQHSDAYTYVTMICGAYGSNGVCMSWIPITNSMPASWQLCLRGKDKNDNLTTGCIDVPEPQYDRYQVGSRYPS